MTDALAVKPELGRYGVWTAGSPTPEQAGQIEQLGYDAIWVGGSPAAELAFVEPLLEATSTLQVATGIVNIWSAPAAEVAQSFHRIEARYPGRFLLGIGVGHREATADYHSPYQAMNDYLDALDDALVPTSRRVLAALGPTMLRLAARRSAGAHPYLTTPEHTAAARELIGPSVFLAPEHKVVLSSPDQEGPAAARAAGREAVGFYLRLSNYVNNWRRSRRHPGARRLEDVDPDVDPAGGAAGTHGGRLIAIPVESRDSPAPSGPSPLGFSHAAASDRGRRIYRR